MVLEKDFNHVSIKMDRLTESLQPLARFAVLSMLVVLFLRISNSIFDIG